ncbi:MAG TPA: hypothetical protein VFU50_05910 [Terriglobales bacterium]|nr:hypothetical protein [Terriglobales bacterium]
MSKQSLRNLLRWGGLAIAIIGFILGRTAHTLRVYKVAQTLMWIGLAMIVGGIIVRMFISEPRR